MFAFRKLRKHHDFSSGKMNIRFSKVKPGLKLRHRLYAPRTCAGKIFISKQNILSPWTLLEKDATKIACNLDVFRKKFAKTCKCQWIESSH